MESKDCERFIKNHWPTWEQFTTFLKWIIPILLFFYQISVIDYIASVKNSFEPDIASIIFIASSSFVLLHFKNLIPDAYKPDSQYCDTILQVILQTIYVELALRFLIIPFEYLLHYACIHGYVGFIVKNFLSFLSVFEGFIPCKKFVRLSHSEEGYQLLRVGVSQITLVAAIVWSSFYLRILLVFKSAKTCMLFLTAPLRKSKKRGRKKKRFLFFF